jgi:hypothetical protein
LAGDSAASGGCGGRVGAPGRGRGCAACTISYAFDAAPQMARIHPMGREVLRILASLHRRGVLAVLGPPALPSGQQLQALAAGVAQPAARPGQVRKPENQPPAFCAVARSSAPTPVSQYDSQRCSRAAPGRRARHGPGRRAPSRNAGRRPSPHAARPSPPGPRRSGTSSWSGTVSQQVRVGPDGSLSPKCPADRDPFPQPHTDATRTALPLPPAWPALRRGRRFPCGSRCSRGMSSVSRRPRGTSTPG